MRLLHGDFRNGNIMFDPDRGVAAVLDWELGHIGDPAEDMGWICTNSWRFGRPEKPVSSDVVAEDKELIASALTALLGDYMRMFNMDSGAAEPWAHGIVGMVQNNGEWWLDRRSMGRDSVVEYLTQIIWAAIDGLSRQHGVVIDPNQPLEANKVVQLGRAEPDSLEETS